MTRSSQDEQPLVAIQDIHVTFLRKIMRQMNIEFPARYCVLLNCFPHWSHFLWHVHVDSWLPQFSPKFNSFLVLFLVFPMIFPNFHVDFPSSDFSWPVFAQKAVRWNGEQFRGLGSRITRSTRSTPGRTCWRGQRGAQGAWMMLFNKNTMILAVYSFIY